MEKLRKTKSSSGSLKEKLEKRKKEIKERQEKGNVVFQKEGTLRVRILNTGEDNEFVFEVISFYLGGEIQGVFSPATFGEPCALMEKYEELKASGDPDDKDLAKKMSPKRRYLAASAIYTDLAGKKLDEEKSGKLIQLSTNQYQEIIDLFLDSEWGDMTHPIEGYDLKLSRTGKGQFDTEYTVNPCKNTKAPKGFTKPVDLETMVRHIIPTYEETVDILNRFLKMGSGDTEKPDKNKRSLKKKKSKRHDDDLPF